MAILTFQQNRFTQGEITLDLIDRNDIKQYSGALSTAINVTTNPQGSLKRAYGFEYIDEIENSNIHANITPDSIIANNYFSSSYSLNAEIKVNQDTTVQTSYYPNNASNTYSGSGQEFGTELILNFNEADKINKIKISGLLKLGLITAWSISDYNDSSLVAEVKHSDSNYDYSINLGNYSPILSGEYFIFDINLVNQYFGNNDDRVITSIRFKIKQPYTINGNVTYRLSFAFYSNYSNLYIDKYIESIKNNIKLINFEFNKSQTYIIVCLDRRLRIYYNSAFLQEITSNEILDERIPNIDYCFGGDVILLFHEDMPTLKIVRDSSNNSFTVSNLIYSNIPTYDFGTGTEESIWSNTRGYPRHGVFYQGRLYVDGGKSRPTTLFASNINDYYNFDAGTGLDDEAILGISGDFEPINNIIATNNLIIFTAGGEYIIPQATGTAVTPKNAVLQKQSSIGSFGGLRVKQLENRLLFVERSGKSIQSLTKELASEIFISDNISLLSSHMIYEPKDFAVSKSNSNDNNSYILFTREDGVLIIGNIYISQNVISLTQRTTKGRILSCFTSGDDIYVVTARIINTIEKCFLEKINKNNLMDCSKVFNLDAPTNEITCCEFVANSKVDCIIDGVFFPEVQSDNAGKIQLPVTANSKVEIGFNFNCEIRDLPVNIIAGQSNIIERNKSLCEVMIRGNNLQDITINDIIANSNNIHNGVFIMQGFNGWNYDITLNIKFNKPTEFEINSIIKKVKI